MIHRKYKIATVLGNYTAILPLMFEEEMTLIFPDNSGTQTLQMPETSLIPINKVITLSFTGKNIPKILPFASELLDGQAATGSPANWVIPMNGYIGTFKPVQCFSLVWDGINFHLKGNN
jgi:hypothetical protein